MWYFGGSWFVRNNCWHGHDCESTKSINSLKYCVSLIAADYAVKGRWTDTFFMRQFIIQVSNGSRMYAKVSNLCDKLPSWPHQVAATRHRHVRSAHERSVMAR